MYRTFKLSNDPKFVVKRPWTWWGLYLNPPEHALVLSCDEKSPIQALDRTQPGLPLKKGRCGTMTHDYKRTAPRRCSPPWNWRRAGSAAPAPGVAEVHESVTCALRGWQALAAVGVGMLMLRAYNMLSNGAEHATLQDTRN